MFNDRVNGLKKEKVISIDHTGNQHLKKGIYYARIKDWPKALEYFKKTLHVMPMDKKVHYAIAYYLAELNFILEQDIDLVKEFSNKPDPYIYFLAGIYYCMEEDIDGAEYHLIKFLEKGPEGELKKEAEDLINNIDEAVLFEDNLDYIKLTCNYADRIEGFKKSMEKKFESPFVQSTMAEYLYKMDDYMVSNIIFLYGFLEKNKIAEKALLNYIKSPIAQEKHIELALLSLKKIGSPEPYEVLIKNKMYQVTLKSYMRRDKNMEELCSCWNDVLKFIVKNMENNRDYSDESIKRAKHMWVKLINALYPQLPQLDEQKKKVWAAGLELNVAESKCFNTFCKRLAMAYNVSPEEILKKHDYIKKTLRFRILNPR